MYWYRCLACHGVVSNKDIMSGRGCRKCKGIKIRPTQLTLVEQCIELFRWPQLLVVPRLWKSETWMNKKEVGHGEGKGQVKSTNV